MTSLRFTYTVHRLREAGHELDEDEELYLLEERAGICEDSGAERGEAERFAIEELERRFV